MFMKRLSLRDFIYMALLAVISIVARSPFRAVSELFASTFGLPGGIINGVFYMFWLTAAYGIVKKPGTVTLFCVLQAFLGINILGMPLIRALTFIPPGVVVDLFHIVLGEKINTRTFMILAGGLANVSGTITVSLLIMNLPLYPLIIACLTAFISGGFGGYFAYALVKTMKIKISNVNMSAGGTH